MPAAAVIPAPLVYTNAVAVKKLVVGFGAAGSGSAGGLRASTRSALIPALYSRGSRPAEVPFTWGGSYAHLAQGAHHGRYCEQNSVFQAVGPRFA